MTDLTYRPGGAPVIAGIEKHTARVRSAAPSIDAEASVSGRVALAALSAGAGAIHLAMAPMHWGDSGLEGGLFAASGWLQIAFAVAVLSRAVRPMLWLSTFLNFIFIAAWAISRTAGLPFGPDAGIAESVGFVDLAAVSMEAALILATLAMLARPTVGGGWGGRSFSSIATVGVVAVTTMALGSPSFRNHVHSHDAGAGAAAAGDGHVHTTGAATNGSTAANDLGLGMLHNGQHAHMQLQQLSIDDQRALDQQLDITRQVAAKYPTLADATAAGYRRAGPYMPGLGVHYVMTSGSGLNPDGVVDNDDLWHPLSIIYEGLEPTSHIAGFMYYSATGDAPSGFIGPNDFWHYHNDVCTKMSGGAIESPFGADRSSTVAQCAAVGGALMPRTQWMVHVWTAPGYGVKDADGGVFAEVNPALKCPDGTYHMMPDAEFPNHLLNFCASELSKKS